VYLTLIRVKRFCVLFRMEAFRSAFHLVKARQCPFFYVCLNNMTCLFCSAGTQGQDHTAIYVTPTTISFRKALNEQSMSTTH